MILLDYTVCVCSVILTSLHVSGESDNRERGDLMAPAGLPSRLPTGDPLHGASIGGVVDLLVLALALVFVLSHVSAGDPLHGGVVDLHVLPLALVVACFPVGDPLGAADFPLLVLDFLVVGDPLHG